MPHGSLRRRPTGDRGACQRALHGRPHVSRRMDLSDAAEPSNLAGPVLWAAAGAAWLSGSGLAYAILLHVGLERRA